jgi:hypothetical protein
MICKYCGTFQDSEIRVNSERFCIFARKMVSKTDPVCREFSLCTSFYCNRNECQLDVVCCPHRQQNSILWPECSKCSQKYEIADARRFAGRVAKMKANNHIPEEKTDKKKIIIRRATA